MRSGGAGSVPGRGVRAHGGRQPGRGELRFPPTLAVLVAAVLFGLLPEHLVGWARWAIPALEVVLGAVLVAVNPRRLTRETRWSRALSIALTALVIVSNIVALVLLVAGLVSGRSSQPGALLVAGLQVWLTDLIAFALLFWELDRGGSVSRTQVPREDLPLADFRFTQDEDHDTVTEVARGSSAAAEWIPTFVDYLFLSTTNSMAFSPTDTMPLSTRAKVLMAVEALASQLISLVIVAYAIGGLGS